MRFLICRLSSLGDVACCVPAAIELRRLYPKSQIVWAVDPRFAGVVECCPSVDEVVLVKPKFAPSSWPSFEGEFDAVLDLQGLSKSAIVAARARSKVKLGYHWQREGAQFVSSPVMPDRDSIHVVDQYIDVVRALPALIRVGEIGPQTNPPWLAPQPEGIESVKAKLGEIGAKSPYVVLNPGAGWVTKRWPPASFAAVSDWLAQRGVSAVFIGGNSSEDHTAFGEVAAVSKVPPFKMTGRTTVRELIALIAGAEAHVGGDTGSSHLAAMLGVKAVGLYSITKPARSCPYWQSHNCLYSEESLAMIAPDAVTNLLGA